MPSGEKTYKLIDKTIAKHIDRCLKLLYNAKGCAKISAAGILKGVEIP